MRTYIIVHLLFYCHTNPLRNLKSLTNRKSKLQEVHPKVSCLHPAKEAEPVTKSSVEPYSVKGCWLSIFRVLSEKHTSFAKKIVRYKNQRMKLLSTSKYFSIP